MDLWQKFLNGISKLHITIMRTEKTLADTKSWLIKQIAPSFAAVLMSEGGDTEFIHQLLDSGVVRINRSQKRQLMQMGIVL